MDEATWNPRRHPGQAPYRRPVIQRRTGISHERSRWRWRRLQAWVRVLQLFDPQLGPFRHSAPPVAVVLLYSEMVDHLVHDSPASGEEHARVRDKDFASMKKPESFFETGVDKHRHARGLSVGYRGELRVELPAGYARSTFGEQVRRQGCQGWLCCISKAKPRGQPAELLEVSVAVDLGSVEECEVTVPHRKRSSEHARPTYLRIRSAAEVDLSR